MSIQSLQILLSLSLSAVLLSGCGAGGVKSTSEDGATAASGETIAGDADGEDSSKATGTTGTKASSKVGRLKKRKVPYRPNPNPVTNKALADNLMAARVKEAERFLKQGADASTIAANGEPVLYTALRFGFDEMADSLVLYGADVNAQTRAGRTPLHIAISKGNDSLVQLLLENGADANLSSGSGETPLSLAIERAHVGIVAKLLNYGADANTGSQKGTPLQVVLRNGNIKIAELLARNKADVNITDSIGESLLHKAASRGQVGFAGVIIDNGANVNARDKYRETPLHEAAAKGRLAMVKLLLSKNADLYAKTEKKWTALHEAARFGHPETAAYLISRGLSRNAHNSDGVTPRGLANHLKHGKVIEVLK